MRLISLALLLSALFIFTIPTHAANCDGLQLSGALSTGTYSMTDVCDITGTLTVASGETVTINGNGFTINGSDSHQIFDVSSGGTLNLNNVTLTNGVGINGGAIYNSGTVTITNSTFSDNSLTNLGGAIYNEGTLTIINSIFSGNSAIFLGGAIYNSDGTVSITNSTFSSNSAPFLGGTIQNNGGIVNITNSTFSDSSADSGGTIINLAGSTLNIINSTFSDSSADFDGGIIFNSDTVTITNSTFSGSSAVDDGGAIYNFAGATLSITNSTFSGNDATNGGAVFNFSGGTVSITNSIISGNTFDNCSGTITDNGGNIEDGTSCSFSINADPMLGTFNGAYFPLLDGSPAIDAAPGCAGQTADQIGNARPFGPACDSGAIEAEYIVTETGETEIIAPATAAPPMCNTITDISAPGLPDGVYCRVLMQNGAWMTQEGTVPGNLALANPIIAVDVFRITGQSVTSNDFGGYVQICLPGTGRIIFLDATQSPRPQVEITPVEFIGGSTCGWIPNAGTVVLLSQ